MKKIISFVLIFAMCLTLVPMVALAAEPELRYINATGWTEAAEPVPTGVEFGSRCEDTIGVYITKDGELTADYSEMTTVINGAAVTVGEDGQLNTEGLYIFGAGSLTVGQVVFTAGHGNSISGSGAGDVFTAVAAEGSDALNIRGEIGVTGEEEWVAVYNATVPADSTLTLGEKARFFIGQGGSFTVAPGGQIKPGQDASITVRGGASVTGITFYDESATQEWTDFSRDETFVWLENGENDEPIHKWVRFAEDSWDPNAPHDMEYWFEYDIREQAQITRANDTYVFPSRWSEDYHQPEAFYQVEETYEAVSFVLRAPNNGTYDAPVVRVEVFNGNDSTPNSIVAPEYHEGVYTFTPQSEKGFIVRVWWSQAEKDYDDLQPGEGEIAVEINIIGSETAAVTSASLPTAEGKKISLAGKTKYILADSITPLALTITPGNGEQINDLFLGDRRLTTEGESPDYTVAEGIAAYTWDITNEHNRYIEAVFGGNQPGPGGRDIEVFFPEGVTVDGNNVSFSVGDPATSVTVTVAGATVEAAEGRYKVMVPRNDLSSVTFTVDTSFHADTMQVALHGDQEFNTVLALTESATCLAAHNGGLPDWVNFEIETTGGPQNPPTADGIQFQLKGPSRGTVTYTIGSAAASVNNLGEGSSDVSSDVIHFDTDTTVTFAVACQNAQETFSVHIDCSDKSEDVHAALNSANNGDFMAVLAAGESVSFPAAAGKGYTIRVEFGQQELPWYTVSWAGGNVTVTNGEVIAERVHVAAHDTEPAIIYTINEDEVDTENHIYNLWETIGKQKEQEEDPDSLQLYGIGFSQSDLFIAPSLEGVSIDYKFIPKYGYQLKNIYTNEQQEDSCLNNFTTDDENISTFTFNVLPGGNVHFCVYFEAVPDTVTTTGAANINGAYISDGGNAASSGNLALTVADTTTDTSIRNAVGTLELSLNNVVSKGGENGSWTTSISEFDDPITLTLTLDKTEFDAANYSIVRDHNGVKQDLNASYNAATGELTFRTNQFSDYTIVKKENTSGGIGGGTVAETRNVTVGNASATVADGKATVKSVDMTKTESGKAVSLDFSEVGAAVHEVQLPTEAVKAISETSEHGVEIKLTDAQVKLDAATLKTIRDALGSEDMSLSVKVGGEAIKTLSAEQATVIGSLENTVVISATITAGDEKISEFGGGTVVLTVDYPWNGKGILRAAFVKDDGSVEIIPVTFANGKATLSVRHFSSYVVYTEEALPFADVADPTAYYYDAVKWAVKCKVTSGVDATHFAPNAITTRAQMVTFLWRAAGSPEPTSDTCAFTDVKADAYYYKAVLWAIEQGITKGTSETAFSPDMNVSRGQTVTFLARMNGVRDDASGYTHSFTDVKAADYYNNAVAWAATNNITNGTNATTFSPNDDCLRGQIVTFLWRSFVK